MRSVRFDEQLDERVRRAAEREGITVSEFIRRGAAERAERTLGQPAPPDALADYIGSFSSGGDARDHEEEFAAILEEKYSRRAG